MCQSLVCFGGIYHCAQPERRSLNCDLPRVMGVIGIVCKIEASCFAFTLRKIKFGALSLILVLILDLRFKWLPWEMGLKAWQALWGAGPRVSGIGLRLTV